MTSKGEDAADVAYLNRARKKETRYRPLKDYLRERKGRAWGRGRGSGEKSRRHATIVGLDFYVDTWVKLTNEKITPGSDEEHIQLLIRVRGYKMPASMMSVRLAHLLDEQKCKELMFIYSEDLAPTGFTAAEIQASQSAIRNPKSAFPLQAYDQ